MYIFRDEVMRRENIEQATELYKNMPLTCKVVVQTIRKLVSVILIVTGLSVLGVSILAAVREPCPNGCDQSLVPIKM